AEVAAEKALHSAHPKELPPGKYTVVLEPAAVLDLLGFMFFDFGGTALLEQRSFLNNRIGTRLFGENVTIHDDVYHPLQSGATFDGEGVGRQNGSLACGVWNFRVNRSLIDVVENVELLRNSVRASGRDSFDMMVPAMKVKNFNFTELTKI